jgi:hypothetical protein
MRLTERVKQAEAAAFARHGLSYETALAAVHAHHAGDSERVDSLLARLQPTDAAWLRGLLAEPTAPEDPLPDVPPGSGAVGL